MGTTQFIPNIFVQEESRLLFPPAHSSTNPEPVAPLNAMPTQFLSGVMYSSQNAYSQSNKNASLIKYCKSSSPPIRSTPEGNQTSSKGAIKGLFILVGDPALLRLPAPNIERLGPNLSRLSVLTTSPLLSKAPTL